MKLGDEIEMLEKIKKVPAGTFLIPMILSMVVYTLFPDLFQFGGMTQILFGGSGVGLLAAIMTFLSGTLIDVSKIGALLKRQGVLFLSKIVISLLLSWGFVHLFGQDGVFGISALAFVSAITSVNSAIYLLTAQEYGGTEEDAGAYGLFGILSLPVLPTLFYSILFSSNEGVNWMPVISILIPLFLGILLGNIDPAFRGLFGPGISALLPLLGWNLGWGINLVGALQAGIPGLILTAIFFILTSSMILIDQKVLGNDGLYGMTLVTVAGISTSSPGIMARIFPSLHIYVADATSQVLLACVITSIVMPIFIAKRYERLYQTQ